MIPCVRERGNDSAKSNGAASMQRMPNDEDMLEEYDFSGGEKGKYVQRYAEGTNVVVIDPDVAEYFPDHDSVNEALRRLAAVTARQCQTKQ